MASFTHFENLHPILPPLKPTASSQPSPSLSAYSSPSLSSNRKPPISLPGQGSQNRVKQTAALFERVASNASNISALALTPNRLPDDRRSQFDRRHSSQPSSHLSSSRTSYTPEHCSDYPSLPNLSTSPDLQGTPDSPKLDSDFRQMLSFPTRSSLEPCPTTSLASFPESDPPAASQDSGKKFRTALDLPYPIPSLIDDFAQHTMNDALPQPELNRTLDEPRSDSDSTTTSHMQNSSNGTFSINGSDNHPSANKPKDPNPTTECVVRPDQAVIEDIFLEQEPKSLVEAVTDSSPLDAKFELSSPIPLDTPTRSQHAQPSKLDTNLSPSSQSPHSSPDLIQSPFDSISVLATSARMTEVGMMIQEVALALFEVQELRHSNAFNSDSRSKAHNPNEGSPSVIASTKASAHSARTSAISRSAGASALTPVDRALMKLDKKVEETTVEVAHLEELLTPFKEIRSAEEVDFLKQKYHGLITDWSKIQKDTELLRDELKEDKWLVVFRTVSAQAEEMMESLEKVLTASQEFMWDFKKQCGSPDRARRSRTASRHPRSSNGSEVEILCDSSSLVMSPEAVQDLLDRYLVLCKNFVAKKKHYVPSCERVLTTLVKGIENRSTKNGEVLRRYADMRTRFQNIQQHIIQTDAELSRTEIALRQTIESDGQPPADPADVHASPVAMSNYTPKSNTSSTRTSRAFNSVTQYLTPSSPQFLSKHSPTALSPFKKLASKITTSKSRPFTPSVTPSVASSQGVQTRIPSNPTHPHSSNSGSAPRDLRRVRSILHPRSSHTSADLSTPSYQTRVNHPFRSAPVNKQEKPRWNISLKRMEDPPESLDTPLRRSTATPVPGRASSRCPSRYSHMPPSHSTAWASSSVGVRTAHRVGSMPPEASFAHHYARPASAAGRSDCSALTSMSMACRPRPPSRNTRIPAPVWDAIISQPTGELSSSSSYQRGHSTSRPGPSSRCETPGTSRLPRPASRCATPGFGKQTTPKTLLTPSSMGSGAGPFSPTNSDIAKLPIHPTRRESSESQGMNLRDERRMKRGVGVIGYDHNPYDPLDRMVWKIVKDQMMEIGLRRIDPPLSRNPEKVKSAGGGIGDQARYRFVFYYNEDGGEIEEERESKALMCKLVAKHRSTTATATATQMKSSEEKVLVRLGGGWKELEMYLLDEQEKSLRRS